MQYFSGSCKTLVYLYSTCFEFGIIVCSILTYSLFLCLQIKEVFDGWRLMVGDPQLQKPRFGQNRHFLLFAFPHCVSGRYEKRKDF